VPVNDASNFFSSFAAPSSIAMCASWPQACILPGCSEMKLVVSGITTSCTGSASMSERSAITGCLPEPIVATMPCDATGYLYGMPSSSSTDRTIAAVLVRSYMSSGDLWRRRRTATIHSAIEASEAEACHITPLELRLPLAAKNMDTWTHRSNGAGSLSATDDPVASHCEDRC
jgi:hypothetical protein